MLTSALEWAQPYSNYSFEGIFLKMRGGGILRDLLFLYAKIHLEIGLMGEKSHSKI